MTASNHHCPGCSRPLGPTRPWCAPCHARVPADLTRAAAEAETRLAGARAAVEQWLAAHPAASERDLDILTLVAQGMSTTDIAASLHLSQHTVKDHLRRMSARWGCKGRANLVSTGYRLGYLKIVRGSV